GDHLEAEARLEARRVERRHVDVAEPGDGPEALGAREPGALALGPLERDARRHLLAVADHYAVEERRDRLGVGRVRSAGDDERIALAAIRRAERDAPEVEHGEDVRVRQLELEREADDVEVAERPARLERHAGQAALA